MRIRIKSMNRIGWNVLVLAAAVTVLGVAGPAVAQDYSSLEIIEGQGVGDVVTLGMTRAEIILVADNGNCDTADSCSFRLSPDTAALTVSFDASDRVDYITINQGGIFEEYRWSTTAGATDYMSPEEVAALYPGSVIESGYPWDYVNAQDYGYTYGNSITCSYVGCTESSIHYVYWATEPVAQEFSLELEASYDAGTLSLDFTIGTPASAYWVNYMILITPTVQLIPLWTKPLPVNDPPFELQTISIPLASGQGYVGIWSALYTTEGQEVKVITWVDTGIGTP